MPFLDNIDRLKKLDSDWADYCNYVHPFQEIFDNGAEMETARQFIGEEVDSVEKTLDNDGKERYIRLWKRFSVGADDFSELIYKITSLHQGNYDVVLGLNKVSQTSIWNSKLAHVTVQAARKISADLLKNQYSTQLLRSLLALQPVDVLNANAKILPDTALEFYMDYAASLSLWVDYFPKNTEVNGETVWYLFEQIQQRGKNLYAGTAHLEAAAVFDELNQKQHLSWNMLTVAAYWAGKNNSDMMGPIFEAAHHVSEKNNWHEIKETLSRHHERFSKLA
jgi:hypothetical protein